MYLGLTGCGLYEDKGWTTHFKPYDFGYRASMSPCNFGYWASMSPFEKSRRSSMWNCYYAISSFEKSRRSWIWNDYCVISPFEKWRRLSTRLLCNFASLWMAILPSSYVDGKLEITICPLTLNKSSSSKHHPTHQLQNSKLSTCLPSHADSKLLNRW